MSGERILQIWLKDVTCRDREGLFFSDDFFVLGLSIFGLEEEQIISSEREIATPLLNVDEGQTKQFDAVGGLLFSSKVEPSDTVAIVLKAYDADFDKGKYSEKYMKLIAALAFLGEAAVNSGFTNGATTPSWHTITRAISEKLTPLLASVMNLMCPADLLGEYSKYMPASDWFKLDGQTKEWNLTDRSMKGQEKASGTWNYIVHYEIKVVDP